MSTLQDLWHLIDFANAEASYGAGQAGQANWYELTGPGFLEQTFEKIDNREAITGSPYSDQGSSIIKRKLVSGTLNYPGILDAVIAWHMQVCGGPSTSGAGDPFTHDGRAPGLAVKEPPSLSVVQGTDRVSTAAYKEYPGIVAQSVKGSIEKGGLLDLQVELVGSGDETDASGETPPAIGTAIRTDLLCWEDIAFTILGPGSQDISDKLHKFEWTLRANLIRRETTASGVLAATWEYDQKKGVELEVNLTIRGQRGDAVWGYYKDEAGTGSLRFDWKIEKSASRSFRIRGFNCQIDEMDDKQFDEAGQSLLVFPLKFNREAGAPYNESPFLLTGLNGMSQILG